MRRRKIGVLIVFLALAGVLAWQVVETDSVRRLQKRAKNSEGISEVYSDDNVLTQKTLLVSNLSSELEKTADLEQEDQELLVQIPSRENGWVAANTTVDIDRLARSETAILLRNARIETLEEREVPIPTSLQAGKEPGCYIIQAQGNIDQEFYRQLERLGGKVISYIPNNAALVAISAENLDKGEAKFASVLPYHPYYKLDKQLLEVALNENQEPYRAGTVVQVALIPGGEESFASYAKSIGMTVLSRMESPFGQVAMVQPRAEQITQLARLPEVHLMGVTYPRALANDLTMQRLNITTNPANVDTYLGLSGKDILLNVNDEMVDDSHPALQGRIIFAEDTNGNPVLPSMTNDMSHGTHVMGTILGNGAESDSVGTNASGSVSGALFKGVATNAMALYLPVETGVRGTGLEADMIRWAAETNYIERRRTNVLISNNSWNFINSPEYDLSASMFDLASRDALTTVSGSQPMLFVFSAGNAGYGNEDGRGGDSDTILSPATAKNVITVGALESARNLTVYRTNEVYFTNIVDGVPEVSTNFNITTNSTLMDASDDDSQVASYSSRGNVGIGTEGSRGRIKPDVVAPGSYIISTRGAGEDNDVPENYEEVQIFASQILEINSTNNYAFFGATNIVGITVEVFTNASTVLPMPDLKIFLKKGASPTGGDYVGDNSFTTNFVITPDEDSEDDSSSEDQESSEGEDSESGSEDDDGGSSTGGSDEEEPVISPGFGDWYLSIAGAESEVVYYDLVLTLTLRYSDEEREYYEDLEAANESLGDYYRYETGTSMAAAAVTGTLALVQEFFETYAPAGTVNPSPALLKALLINGSNPVSNDYSRREPYGVNYSGWGIPNMTNLIPVELTNSDSSTWPIWFVDQNPTNALSTGESWEQLITVPAGYNEGNMKVTLVWTDPAGNPSAAVKLVNDLDLVVSNSVTHQVYVGNDFPISSDYNSAYSFDHGTNDSGEEVTPPVESEEGDEEDDTETPSSGDNPLDPNSPEALMENARDFVNNVESVIIKGPLDTNYVISVQARRVNVNAVTAHPDGIVQDFALVVSFQNTDMQFSSTNSFDIEDPEDNEGLSGTNLWVAPIDIVTNSVAMLKQKVGANSPLIGIGEGEDYTPTNGVPAQWHFYVFTNSWWSVVETNISSTNTTGGTEGEDSPDDGEEDGEDEEDNPDDEPTTTRVRVGGPNVAFSTFLPPNLAMPARYNNADIDMYVSTNSALTNLDAKVIAEAVEKGWCSRKQGGSELFYMTNALENEVFYIGIKSEDQMAAEYGFVGISSEYPFDENDNGNRIVRFNPGGVWVPDGSPDEPGGNYLFGIVTDSIAVDNIIITNTYYAENAGDLYISLSHSSSSWNDGVVVLHNHSFFDDILDPVETNEVIIVYDDSDMAPTDRRKTDGPGTLQDFQNDEGSGLWLMTLVDNALNHTNRVASQMYITPYNANNVLVVAPYSFVYRAFDVAEDVIAVNITISEIDPELPLELYVLYGEKPTLDLYDYKDSITPPGRTVTITRDDIPALETGRYWLGVYNPNAEDVQFELNIEFVHGFIIGDDLGTPSERTPLELQDDAYTLSQVGTNTVVDEETGESQHFEVIHDSIITVDEDRVVDNVNVGVRIDHPRISDLSISLVSPSGKTILLSENRGWGATNAAPDEVALIPNEDNNSCYGSGTTNDPGEYTYAFFSSDTNYTLMPIKFEQPPFLRNGRGEPVYTSPFEDAVPGDYSYIEPVDPDTVVSSIQSGDFLWSLVASTNTVVNWNEETEVNETNLVTVTNYGAWVWTDELEAYNGTNFLIGNRAVFTTTFTNLIPNTNYILRIPFKRPEPLDGLIAWWKGNEDYNDSLWNLPLEAMSGQSWPQFDPDGKVGYGFGMTNAALVGKAPHILSETATNFTVEGWFKVDPNIVQEYANKDGGPNMPLFEFSQYVTNWVTNVVELDEETFETNIVEEVLLDRGLSAWLKGSVWSNSVEQILPHGTFCLELGKDVHGEPVSLTVNLVNQIASPTADEYLAFFTNWVHLAVTFATAPEGDVVRIFSNGTMVLEQVFEHNTVLPDLLWDFNLGYGTELFWDETLQGVGSQRYFYQGGLDEFSWYSRALETNEVESIYQADFLGKTGLSHPPLSVNSAAKVTLRVQGAETNLFSASLPDILTQWQVGNGHFVTPPLDESSTNEVVYELIIDVARGAVAFDDISITTRGVAYEPEVSLNNLKEENARGDWQLLIQDTRAGATNPTPILHSWTLDLGYQATNVVFIDLNEENDYSYSGTITNLIEELVLSGEDPQTVYFRVMVPSWATAATNLLVGDQDMVVAGRWSGVPKFDLAVDDYQWFYTAPETNSYILTTNISSQASLIPGGRYYLALRSGAWTTNDVNYSIKVDFGEGGYDPEQGVISLTNGVPYLVDPEQGGGARSVDYYRFTVETNAVAASFLVYDAPTNLVMVISRGLPLPTDSNYSYSAASGNSGYAQVMIYTNSAPVPLSAGNWYIGVYNGAYNASEPFTPISYKIIATQYTVNPPVPLPMDSGAPITARLEPGETHYYQYNVTANAISLWTQIDQILGGNLNVYNKYGLPLPDVTNCFYDFAISPTNSLDWMLTTDATNSYPLTQGSWFYAIENTNDFAVDYRIRVTEFSIDPSLIVWLTNGVASTNLVGLLPDGTNRVYYGYDVSTNAVGSLFEVFDRKDGNVALYIMPGQIPDPSQYLYWDIATEGLTNAYTRYSAWSGSLTAGYWFFTAMNDQVLPDTQGPSVTYQIRATEFNPPEEEDIIGLVNNYPIHVANAPVYSESYYRYTTGQNPLQLSFTVTNVTQMVSMYLLNTSPAAGPTVSVYPLQWVWMGGVITLDSTNTFLPLTQGNWYLVVENTALYPTDYDVWATEVGAEEPEQPIDTGLEYDPETGLATLVWASEIGAKYGVQGTYNIFDTPVVWEQFDEVIASNQISRYPLTRELMERYVFFSVKLLERTNTIDPENIDTYVNYDSFNGTLNLSWYGLIGNLYYIEGKESLTDTNWVKFDSMEVASAWPIYSIPVDSPYVINRIQPEGGVTPLCIQTMASYDIIEDELILRWPSTVGRAYSVCAWTNRYDAEPRVLTSVTADGTETIYRIKPAEITDCSWFSIQYADDSMEEITMGISIDPVNQEMIISWNAVVGNHYRLEGATGFMGSSWNEIETVVADRKQMEYHVPFSSGYNMFRVVPLGGSVQPPDPEDPEDTKFVNSISLSESEPGVLIITLDAKEGDTFEIEYITDLSDPSGWQQSGGTYGPAESDGPMEIKIPISSEKLRFFRVLRNR